MIETPTPRYIPFVGLARPALLLPCFALSCALAAASEDPQSCGIQDHAPADATPTTIELRNVGDQTLFIGEAGGDRHDLVSVSIDGADFLMEPAGDLFTALSCAGYLEGNTDLCADLIPPKDLERVLRLEPGASYALEWDGYGWTSVFVTEACGELPCGGIPNTNCLDGRAPEVGATVQLRVTPWTSCEGPEQSCACADQDPSCLLALPRAELPTLGEPLEATELEFELTGDTVVVELGL